MFSFFGSILTPKMLWSSGTSGITLRALKSDTQVSKWSITAAKCGLRNKSCAWGHSKKKLANANTPELLNRNNTGPRGQIQRLVFLLRPIKKGWSDNNPPNKILAGGAKKNRNKTLKKHNTYKKKKRNITINKK